VPAAAAWAGSSTARSSAAWFVAQPTSGRTARLSRTIKRGHIHLMVRVELEEPQASEVRKRIARPTKSAAALAARKPAKKKVAKAAPAPVAAAAEVEGES